MEGADVRRRAPPRADATPRRRAAPAPPSATGATSAISSATSALLSRAEHLQVRESSDALTLARPSLPTAAEEARHHAARVCSVSAQDDARQCHRPRPSRTPARAPREGRCRRREAPPRLRRQAAPRHDLMRRFHQWVRALRVLRMSCAAGRPALVQKSRLPILCWPEDVGASRAHGRPHPPKRRPL